MLAGALGAVLVALGVLVVPAVLGVCSVEPCVFIAVRTRLVIACVFSTIASQLRRACSVIVACVCRIRSTSGVVA